MTSRSPLVRQLPAILEDLYLVGTPDYRAEVLAAATKGAQRPRWSFPGIWLPVGGSILDRVAVPPLPWRVLSASILLLIAVAAMLVAGAGDGRRLPPPFGLARNGSVAVVVAGDIHALDPLTGRARAIVAGTTADLSPAFSPDGTKLVFRRAAGNGEDLVVARGDGSSQVTITPAPVDGGFKQVGWAPDSRTILAIPTSGASIWLLDATGPTQPRVVAQGVEAYFEPFRPPDGGALLLYRERGATKELFVRDLRTGTDTVVATDGDDSDLAQAAWSTDGTRIVYQTSPAGDPGSQRLFVVNADGTGTRQLTNQPGTWFDIDPRFSPDGTTIAFTRFENDGSGWDVRPIGIVPVEGGPVRSLGPLSRDVRAAHPEPDDAQAAPGEAFVVQWSPDGTTLVAVPSEARGHPVLIDGASGTSRVLPSVVDPDAVIQVWQRLAD